MAETDQQELRDPDTKQFKIDHQDWRKSKAGSPGFDEDKPPPRGRGRGWRNRARESPTPGNREPGKETSRGQRSLDKQTGTRREDRVQDVRREEEEKKRRLQEERRREDERKWEEERGWKGGRIKEVPRQRSDVRQDGIARKAPRQGSDGGQERIEKEVPRQRRDLDGKESSAGDKSR